MAPSENAESLERFIDAQHAVYDQVIDELKAGTKRSHWMWFVFPQIAGLGSSPMAQFYAIRDLAEARAYLADPVLGTRLRLNVGLLMTHKDKSARQILGTPDDLKLRSCLTLFREAAGDKTDRAFFDRALAQFYASEPDPRTLELLRP